MNISKTLFPILFAASIALAQNPWDEPSAEETPATETSAETYAQPEPSYSAASQSSASSASASTEKAAFDDVRGHAYNPYGNAAAPSTVLDLVATPSDIYGKKLVYISPSDMLGYAAFEMFGGSVLLGLDNSNRINAEELQVYGANSNFAALILGYATPAFGLSLNVSLAKEWTSNSDTDQSARETGVGDNIGLNFSMPFGDATFYANVNWLTYMQSISADYDGTKMQEDYSTILATVGMKGVSGSLSYDGALSVERTGGKFDNDGDVAVDENSALLAGFIFNLGYTALSSENARVLVGLNNILGIEFLDEVDKIQKSDNVIAARISPNILAEVSLFENWLAFAGATHDINIIGGDEDRNEDTSLLGIYQWPETQAFAGIRYKRANWALEAQVAANPFEALNGNNIFANFGGFIYF